MLPIVAKGGAVEAQQDDGDPRARLRAARARLAADSTHLFVLPGYDTDNPALGGGQLVARYRRLTFEELRAVVKAPKGDADFVAVNAQFLVDACDDILIREPDGSLTSLVQGAKTTYAVNLDTNESLGTFLGLDDAPSVQAQMVAAFGGNEHVLNEHSHEVHAWMVSANRADEDSLGER